MNIKRELQVIGAALAVQCIVLIVIGLTTHGWWMLAVVGLVLLCTDALTMLAIKVFL